MQGRKSFFALKTIPAAASPHTKSKDHELRK